LSQEDVDQQFSIGEQIFKLPIDEKLKFRAELEKGGYNGYKPMGLRVSRKSTTRRENRNL
jgi:isopenicillin N synthase-like dioxygenase